MGIQEIQDLGGKASSLGEAHGYPPIADWGQRLTLEANAFQMDSLPKTLAEYEGLVAALMKLVDGKR